MLIDDIVKCINENEQLCESEAPYRYYEVKYNPMLERVEVFFVEEYHSDGDNWGEIDIHHYKEMIFFANYIGVEKYINMLISILNANEQELEYYYGGVLKKVSFVML